MRIALAPLFFLLWGAAAQAQYPFGAGMPTWTPGVTPSAPTFHVSSSASGSGDGSSGAPWTLAQANAGPVGGYIADTFVLFSGTFSASLSLTATQWATSPSASHPVTFDVEGGGATFNSGSANCVHTVNIAGFKLQNFVCVGGGISSTTVDGVLIENNNSGNSKLDYIYVAGMTVSQYGKNCILVAGTGSSSAGFNNVSVVNNIAHDCTGGLTPVGYATQTAGIQVVSYLAYPFSITTPGMTNVLVSGNVIYNNTGHTGGTTWSGVGISVVDTLTGLVENNRVYDNGVNSDRGSTGIIFGADKDVTAQFNEVYRTRVGSVATDGEGIDCDGLTVNCIIQYNYTHDNDGDGILIYTYGGVDTGVPINNSNNVARYNISQNDNVHGGANHAGISVGIDGGGTITGVEIYNNTVYSSHQNAFSTIGVANGAATGHVANNIFYAASGVKVANFDTNLTSVVLDGNDYYTPGTFNIVWNGVTYTSLASWKTASGQETVNGGFNSNPLLTNPGGGVTTGMTNGYQPSLVAAYQLQFGSPLIDTGLNLASHFSISPGSQDYFGTAIPNGGGGTGFNVGSYGDVPSAPVSPAFVQLAAFNDPTTVNSSGWTQALGVTIGTGHSVAVVVGYCLTGTGTCTGNNQTAGPSSVASVTLNNGGTVIATCSKIPNTLTIGATSIYPEEAWGCPSVGAGVTSMVIHFSPNVSFAFAYDAEWSNATAFEGGNANWSVTPGTSWTCPTVTTTGSNEVAVASALAASGTVSFNTPFVILAGSTATTGVGSVAVPSATTVAGASVGISAGPAWIDCAAFAVK